MKSTACPGCGVELPDSGGAVHRYMESSPACWANYGELLAREYENPDYMLAHRLTVDTYAVQHPGKPSAQSVQSVAVHLISLHCVLERGMAHRQATAFLKICADKGSFEWLEPPSRQYTLSVTHPLTAASAEEHAGKVREWANSTWEAWWVHHERVRRWAAALRA
jgi:Family of unknown function (DUF5946)